MIAIEQHPLQSHWIRESTNIMGVNSESLQRDFDIVIIGGGISGFSTAYHIQALNPSLHVAILDARGTIAAGATGRNGGLAWPGFGKSMRNLVQTHGDAEAQRLIRFEEANIEALLQFCHSIDDLSILNRFEAGALKMFSSANDLDECTNDLEILRGWGIDPHAQIISTAAACALTGSNGINTTEHGGLLSSRAYRIQPAKLTQALAKHVQAQATFFANCLVSHVDRTSKVFRIESTKGVFTCQQVVYATNAWTQRLLPGVPIVPIRNQVVCTMSGDHPAGKGRWGFSTNDGYEYMSGRGDGRVVLGGMRYLAKDMDIGCSDDSTLNPRVSAALHQYIDRCFAKMEKPIIVDLEWSGIMGWSADAFPYVGPLNSALVGTRDGEFIIAGFSGHGMTRSFLSGRAVAEMVCKCRLNDEFPLSFLPSSERFQRPPIQGQKIEPPILYEFT